MNGEGELLAVKRIDLAAAGQELTDSFQVGSYGPCPMHPAHA